MGVITYPCANLNSWWRHQMETFSALLAICAGNSPVPGEFPTQRPVTWSFDVYFDLRPNKRLSKQSWGWWFETLSPPLWRHRNVKQVSQRSPSVSTNYITQMCECRLSLWGLDDALVDWFTIMAFRLFDGEQVHVLKLNTFSLIFNYSLKNTLWCNLN